MNEIAKQENEITILTSGEAFISQRKLEELLGLGVGTVNKFLSRQQIKYNVVNGLGVDLVESVSTYYAFDTANPTTQAREFAKKLLKAGTKAYMYSLAGYELTAQRPSSATVNNPLEGLASALNRLDISDELKAEYLFRAATAGNHTHQFTRFNPNPHKTSLPYNSSGTDFLRQLSDDNSLGADFLRQILEISPFSGFEIRKGKLLVNLELSMRELPNEAYWRENRMKLSASLQKMDTFIKYRTDTINGKQAASYIFAI
jgi:hypothetical protein